MFHKTIYSLYLVYNSLSSLQDDDYTVPLYLKLMVGMKVKVIILINTKHLITLVCRYCYETKFIYIYHNK